MLSDFDKEADKIEAFNRGADDYITKPFSIRELIARIHARVKRARGPEDKETATIEIGDIRLESASHTVKKRQEWS
jgi:DNA-binding response OmpR family regulator